MEKSLLNIIFSPQSSLNKFIYLGLSMWNDLKLILNDKFLRYGIYFYSGLCFIIIFLAYLGFDHILSPMLGMFGIGIAVFIAIKQKQTIDKIHSVGRETKETAQALRLDSLVKERVKQYFKVESVNEKYKCIYPHKYLDRPLPSINAGDYYALSILDRRIGSDKLVLRGLAANERLDKEDFTGKVIFVCAHISNPAVKEVFEVSDINCDLDLNVIDCKKTPCWFADDYRKENRSPDDTRLHPVRKIRVTVSGANSLIQSPAEESYIKLCNDPNYRSNLAGVQQDFGILGRITVENNIYFVIAGIHQYGTWIVSEFLDRLLSSREAKYEDPLFGAEDFISVIWGEFDTSRMKVMNAQVHHNYLWIKDGNVWNRYRS